MSVPQQLAATFLQWSNTSHWHVALSGGVDSLMLLHWLHLWSAENAAPALSAVHIHHGLHSAADEWVTACQAACEERGIPLTVIEVNAMPSRGESPEAAARAARYVAFSELLGDNEVLFQGHHLDDQVETVLFRLLRGNGPRGLAGIPGHRTLGGGHLCRPLLAMERATIEAHCVEAGLSPVEDPSNADRRFDRNFLRHEVLPVLQRRWPAYREAIGRAALLQREWVTAVDAEPMALTTTACGALCWSASGAQTHAQLAQRLHRWVLSVDDYAPDRRQLIEFARQVFFAQRDRLPQLALDGWSLCAWRGAVYPVATPLPTLSLMGDVEVGNDYRGAWGALTWHPADDGKPGFTPGLTLHARSRRAGETVKLPGRGSRPLNRCLQECEVPPWWRDAIPVLCDANDALLAVPGAGITMRALTIGVEGGMLPRWHAPQPRVQLSH